MVFRISSRISWQRSFVFGLVHLIFLLNEFLFIDRITPYLQFVKPGMKKERIAG